MTNLIVWLIVGAIAGWLAGKVMKTHSGLITNIAVGLVGAVVGGFLLDQLGMPTPSGGLNLGTILTAFIGSVVLLAILNILRRR